MTRDQILDQLANLICAIRLPHPVRVAIDGVDAAGKTILANDLVAPIQAHGRHVIRASIDGFHRPRNERYARGVDSPEGYYYDSFDYAAIRSCLLEPLGQGGSLQYRFAMFDYRTNSPVDHPIVMAPIDSVLLFDGVFLLRPELSYYWDYRIFVQVDFNIAVRRAVVRDRQRGADKTIEERYWKRYVPGQCIYIDSIRPQELADVIINNNDPKNPELLLCNYSKMNR